MSGITTALGMAGSLAGAGIGQAMNIGAQRDMIDYQIQASKDLANYNHQLGLKMWEDTNYAAQVYQLEKAGLNPALLYGKGGGGGGTVAQGSGGIPSGNAPRIDIGMALQQGAQLAVAKAQAENLQANTEKTQAEKAEIEARTPTHAKQIEKTNSEIDKLASELKVNEETARKIQTDVRETEANINKIKAETNRTNQLTPLDAQRIEQEVKGLITKNLYLDAKERAELQNFAADYAKTMQEIENMKAGITQKDEEIDLNQFRQQMEAKYPSLFNVGGGVLNQVLNFLTGGRDNFYQHTPERRR